MKILLSLKILFFSLCLIAQDSDTIFGMEYQIVFHDISEFSTIGEVDRMNNTSMDANLYFYQYENEANQGLLHYRNGAFELLENICSNTEIEFEGHKFIGSIPSQNILFTAKNFFDSSSIFFSEENYYYQTLYYSWKNGELLSHNKELFELLLDYKSYHYSIESNYGLEIEHYREDDYYNLYLDYVQDKKYIVKNNPESQESIFFRFSRLFELGQSFGNDIELVLNRRKPFNYYDFPDIYYFSPPAHFRAKINNLIPINESNVLIESDNNLYQNDEIIIQIDTIGFNTINYNGEIAQFSNKLILVKDIILDTSEENRELIKNILTDHSISIRRLLGIDNRDHIWYASDEDGLLIELMLDSSQYLSSNNIDHSDINIYPNPSQGIYSIDYDYSLEIESVELFDQYGKKVKGFNFQVFKLDLTEFPNGIYYLVVKDKLAKHLVKKINKL